MALADQAAIQAVIQQQMAAFQQNNAAIAFSFASPAIQAQFGDPETFLRMVQIGYAPVYAPRGIIFGELTTIEGIPAQQVIVMSDREEIVQATYLMQQQADGSWRIHGCFLTPVSGRAD